MNSLSPDLMTSAERLTELAELLAVGIVRLRLRHRLAPQSTALARDSGESSLHLRANQSGDATPTQRRTA